MQLRRSPAAVRGINCLKPERLPSRDRVDLREKGHVSKKLAQISSIPTSEFYSNTSTHFKIQGDDLLLILDCALSISYSRTPLVRYQ